MTAARQDKARGLSRTIFIIALTIGTAASATVAASIEVFRSRAPDRVLAIYPGDGGAIVRHVDVGIQDTAAIPPAAELTRDARAALRNAPLTPGAVRLLGVAAEQRGDAAGARRLYALSDRVTRRDLQTQLVLIEAAVRDNDVPGALRHYDIALRTNARAGELLYPVLGEAIQDAGIRQHFFAIARQKPLWLGDFLASSIRDGGRSVAVAQVIEAMGGPKRVDPGGQLNTALLQGLASDRAFPALRQFYRLMPDARASVLTSVGFDTSTIRPDHAPVSWQIIPSEAVQASFVSGARGTIYLSVTLDPGREVLVARKLLFLPGGRYRFDGVVRQANWISGSQARWLVRCAVDAQEPVLWQGELESRGTDRMTTSGELVIGSQCPNQFLDLVTAAGAEAQVPLELTVESPTLILLSRLNRLERINR